MTARIVTRFHLAERSWPAYGAALWSLVFAVIAHSLGDGLVRWLGRGDRAQGIPDDVETGV